MSIMDKNNLKIRTLCLTTVISKCEKEKMLKCIQSKDGVLNCNIQGSSLSLEYDLMHTSLEELLPGIKPILEVSGIKLKEGFISKVKIPFVCFTERNQRDNIYTHSGWHLRLQNIYLALANHAQEHRDIKTTPLIRPLDKN